MSCLSMMWHNANVFLKSLLLVMLLVNLKLSILEMLSSNNL